MNRDIITSQVIGLLNLSPRDTAGVPVYTTSITGGDTIYAQGEIDQAVTNALLSFMRAICETDGHPDRALFVQPDVMLHGQTLPDHYGSIGVPRITPYSGAGYKLGGHRKTVEEIQAYRANPNGYYSAVAHNASANGMPSKLAGHYAVDEAAQVFHFTGFQAEADIAYFTITDLPNLPETYSQGVTSLAIANLSKDGNVTDIFAAHANIAAHELERIRQKQSDQPSLRKQVGTRESGTV